MSEHIKQLQATHTALVNQLAAIKRKADHVGCEVYGLQDTSGGLMAAPVLVALANVEIALLRLDKLDEIDRNARAYGWEVGHGHPLTDKIESTSEENPFLRANWRDYIIVKAVDDGTR